LSATRLLVINRRAAGVNDKVEAKLRRSFADHLIGDFDPKVEFDRLASKQARIIVAGGDASVEFFMRKLADSRHPIGVIPLGTFNNLARALGIPIGLDRAIRVARGGRPRPITVGRVNGRIFVEACAIGLFGETIALGERAKDMEFGKLTSKLKDVIAARRFRYEIGGDIKGRGSAMSLVFSNTATIGMLLPISEGTPKDAYLEFTVHAGRTRADIIGRAMRSALPKQLDPGDEHVFRFTRLEVTTRPRVRVYADNFLVGRTPATVAAERSALRVLLPG
jgi:diacylglycerol kinase family enzyme